MATLLAGCGTPYRDLAREITPDMTEKQLIEKFGAPSMRTDGPTGTSLIWRRLNKGGLIVHINKGGVVSSVGTIL